MTTLPPAWRSTGLHWESGTPRLTVLALPGNPVDGERSRPAVPGELLAWHLSGPRRCIGIWTGGSRRPCPTSALVRASGTDAQCAGCAAADSGRALARDAALGDDRRTWSLYLAWFGPGLVKVGLTALDRGTDRLLEQGAITYAILATGRYAAIRRAEQAASATGQARERIPTRAKANAWWSLPDVTERERVTEKAAQTLIDATRWPDGVALADDAHVHDLAAVYGLSQPIPTTYQELVGLDEHAAVLTGHAQAVIGRHLLLTTAAGVVLADMRRLAGHTLTACAATAPPAGLQLAPRHRPRDPDDQPQLF